MIKYWLYSLHCTIYSCILLILYIVTCTSWSPTLILLLPTFQFTFMQTHSALHWSSLRGFYWVHNTLLRKYPLIQFGSVTQSCLNLCNPMDCTARQSSLSFTNSQSLLKHTSIESVMPSNHLILCRPLLLLPSILPSIRVFSNESVLPYILRLYLVVHYSMQFYHKQHCNQSLLENLMFLTLGCIPRNGIISLSGLNIAQVAELFLKVYAILRLIPSSVPLAGPGRPSWEPHTQKGSPLA